MHRYDRINVLGIRRIDAVVKRDAHSTDFKPQVVLDYRSDATLHGLAVAATSPAP